MIIKDLSGFEDFLSLFKGDIVFPDDAEYSRSIKRWAETAQRNAGMIAFVKDDEDVKSVINLATQNGAELAVKGGGHSISGTSSTEGGIVIDLSRYLNVVTVDPENNLAYVQGGAVWTDVNKATTPHGLASVAGTVGHTGVGGLTLGGGYGYLTGEHGLVVDNLLEATIIDAHGISHQASETENQDLFWAIRGGGGNFGVATSFTLRLHSQRPEVFLGALDFPPDKALPFFDAVRTWLAIRTPKDVLLVFFAKTVLGHVLRAHIFHNGSEDVG